MYYIVADKFCLGRTNVHDTEAPDIIVGVFTDKDKAEHYVKKYKAKMYPLEGKHIDDIVNSMFHCHSIDEHYKAKEKLLKIIKTYYYNTL